VDGWAEPASTLGNYSILPASHTITLIGLLRCVPKKVTWNAAAMAETMAEAKGYGFDVEVKGFDWKHFVEKRDAYITRLNGIYSRNLNNDGVTYIPGRAKFLSKNEIEVDEQTPEGKKLGTKAVYTADHILIATGIYSSCSVAYDS
jgi:glutathione reductase (NADPH)